MNPLLKHKPGENSQNFHYSGLGVQPISIGQNYKYRNLIKKLTDYNRIKLSHFPSIFPSANSTLPLLASPNNPISLHLPYFLPPKHPPCIPPFPTLSANKIGLFMGKALLIYFNPFFADPFGALFLWMSPGIWCIFFCNEVCGGWRALLILVQLSNLPGGEIYSIT